MMRRIVCIAVIVGAIAAAVYASSRTNSPAGPYDPRIFPIKGVSTAELRDILDLLDAKEEDKVLSIQVRKNTIEVQTGTVKGFLDGRGHSYEFEKVNGKWVIKNQSNWISQHQPGTYFRKSNTTS